MGFQRCAPEQNVLLLAQFLWEKVAHPPDPDRLARKRFGKSGPELQIHDGDKFLNDRLLYCEFTSAKRSISLWQPEANR